MLPNPKNKNINNLLPNPNVSAEDEAQVNQKKLKSKRKIIIFSLIITAGLSFIFWSYKSIQRLVSSSSKLNFNLNINLPRFTFLKNNSATLSDSNGLLKSIKKSTTSWSIFASLDTDYSKPVFEYQSSLSAIDSNINTIVDKITAVKISSQSLLNLTLPQGLSFQEIIDNSVGIYYQGLIHLPKNKILIILKNNNPITPTQIQTEVPSLINDLYWHVVNFLN